MFVSYNTNKDCCVSVPFSGSLFLHTSSSTVLLILRWLTNITIEIACLSLHREMLKWTWDLAASWTSSYTCFFSLSLSLSLSNGASPRLIKCFRVWCFLFLFGVQLDSSYSSVNAVSYEGGSKARSAVNEHPPSSTIWRMDGWMISRQETIFLLGSRWCCPHHRTLFTLSSNTFPIFSSFS